MESIENMKLVVLEVISSVPGIEFGSMTTKPANRSLAEFRLERHDEAGQKHDLPPLILDLADYLTCPNGDKTRDLVYSYIASLPS